MPLILVPVLVPCPELASGNQDKEQGKGRDKHKHKEMHKDKNPLNLCASAPLRPSF